MIMLSASGTRAHSVPQLSTWIWVTEMSNNSHYGKTCQSPTTLPHSSHHVQMHFIKTYKD